MLMCGKREQSGRGDAQTCFSSGNDKNALITLNAPLEITQKQPPAIS
jgi:hypothetical protein